MSDLPPLPKGFVLDGEQQQQPTVPQLPKGFTLDAAPPPSGGLMSSVADFAKSIPGGIANGMKSFAAITHTLSGADEDTLPDPIADFVGEKFNNAASMLPTPEGRAGKFGEAIGSAAGNPISWAGPGGLLLKSGANTLGAIGGEAAGQATEGTKYEGPARFAGSMVGSVAGVKALSPKAPKAAIPTYDELKGAATSDYNAARASGLELHPQGPATFAAAAEQKLTQDFGHTGGANGTAPGTFAVLESLQNAPPGATLTAANIDAVRKNLALRARATSEGKPTPDAQAASVVLEGWNKYLENVPQSHVMAGDPALYNSATKQGNANYAASQRLRTIDLKRTRAENNAEGGIATSIDNQLKSQMRTILNNPNRQRGFSGDELAAMSGVNKGTFTSNTLRQLGRGGAGVIPIMTHAAAAVPAAVATGGASIIPQMLLAGGLYGARKTAESMTVSQAKNLADMIAKRSPEYQARVLGLPANTALPTKDQMVRVLMSGFGAQ